MHTFFVFALAVTAASANYHAGFPLLVGRQTEQLPCSAQFEKDCGGGCIPLTYTCCPDGSGGCPLGAFCTLGSNGQYGCCEAGATCEGPGGANTQPGGVINTQITSQPPKDTSLLPPPSIVSIPATSTASPPPSSPPSPPLSSSQPPPSSQPPAASTTESSAAVISNPTTSSQSPTTFAGAADSNHGSSPFGLVAVVLIALVA